MARTSTRGAAAVAPWFALARIQPSQIERHHPAWWAKSCCPGRPDPACGLRNMTAHDNDDGLTDAAAGLRYRPEILWCRTARRGRAGLPENAVRGCRLRGHAQPAGG